MTASPAPIILRSLFIQPDDLVTIIAMMASSCEARRISPDRDKRHWFADPYFPALRLNNSYRGHHEADRNRLQELPETRAPVTPTDLAKAHQITYAPSQLVRPAPKSAAPIERQRRSVDDRAIAVRSAARVETSEMVGTQGHRDARGTREDASRSGFRSAGSPFLSGVPPLRSDMSVATDSSIRSHI